MMRRLLLVGFAIALAAGAGDETPLTLSDAVRLALERHPDVGKARAAADVLKGRIREVRAQALPQVDIHANWTRWRDPSLLNASGIDKFPPELLDVLVPVPVNLYDYNISVKQPLYTAGKVGTALRLASVEAEGALTDIDRAEQDLALSTVRSFYALMWSERYLSLVLETQDQKKVQAGMARNRFRNGVATEVDVLRSEVAVANGEPDVVRARNAIQYTRAQLNFYLVRPTEFPTKVAGEFEEKAWEQENLETLTSEAFRHRPDLLRLRINERGAAVQLDLARAQSKMSVDFSSQYGIMARLPGNLANPKFSRWLAGVNFTLPVFDGFRRSGLVWQATAAERAARLEREKVEQQIGLGLRQGLDDLDAARKTIEAARATVGQAEKVLTMMQNNYKYGAATTLDVLAAQVDLSQARSNLLRGLHDYSAARASLRWTMGLSPWE